MHLKLYPSNWVNFKKVFMTLIASDILHWWNIGADKFKYFENGSESNMKPSSNKALMTEYAITTRQCQFNPFNFELIFKTLNWPLFYLVHLFKLIDLKFKADLIWTQSQTKLLWLNTRPRAITDEISIFQRQISFVQFLIVICWIEHFTPVSQCTGSVGHSFELA